MSVSRPPPGLSNHLSRCGGLVGERHATCSPQVLAYKGISIAGSRVAPPRAIVCPTPSPGVSDIGARRGYCHAMAGPHRGRCWSRARVGGSLRGTVIGARVILARYGAPLPEVSDIGALRGYFVCADCFAGLCLRFGAGVKKALRRGGAQNLNGFRFCAYRTRYSLVAPVERTTM